MLFLLTVVFLLTHCGSFITDEYSLSFSGAWSALSDALAFLPIFELSAGLASSSDARRLTFNADMRTTGAVVLSFFPIVKVPPGNTGTKATRKSAAGKTKPTLRGHAEDECELAHATLHPSRHRSPPSLSSPYAL